MGVVIVLLLLVIFLWLLQRLVQATNQIAIAQLSSAKYQKEIAQSLRRISENINQKSTE